VLTQESRWLSRRQRGPSTKWTRQSRPRRAPSSRPRRLRSRFSWSARHQRTTHVLHSGYSLSGRQENRVYV